ncbi:hypothetical protein ACJX0J_024462, partial [Zea mays]
NKGEGAMVTRLEGISPCLFLFFLLISLQSMENYASQLYGGSWQKTTFTHFSFIHLRVYRYTVELLQICFKINKKDRTKSRVRKTMY